MAGPELAAPPPGDATADTRALARGASGLLVARLAARALAVLTQVLLARLLGPEVFGLYVLGWTLVTLLGPVADLGLSQGVIRFCTPGRANPPARQRAVIVRSLAIATVAGVAIGATTWLFAPALSAKLLHAPGATSSLRWFAPAIALVAALRVAEAVTRASLRVRYSAVAQDLVQSGAQLLLVLGSQALGFRLHGAVLAAVLSFAAGLAVALHYVRRLFADALACTDPAPRVVPELLRFSLPTIVAQTAARLNGRIERLFVAGLGAVTLVGVYQAASQAALLLPIVLSAFTSSLGPLVADLHHRGERQRLTAVYATGTKWALALSLPPALVLLLAPREVLVALFGRGYEGGAAALVVLALGQLVNVGSGSVGAVLTMTGHQDRWLWISIAALALNVTLIVLLIPRLGLLGAALGTTCANTARFSVAVVEAGRLVGAWPHDRRTFKVLGAAVVAGLAVLALRLLPWPSAWTFVVACAVTATAAFAAATLALGLDAEDRDFFSQLQARLPGRLRRA